jgi:hypothetical protein
MLLKRQKMHCLTAALLLELLLFGTAFLVPKWKTVAAARDDSKCPSEHRLGKLFMSSSSSSASSSQVSSEDEDNVERVRHSIACEAS